MLLNYIKPSPMLADYVRSYRIADFDFSNETDLPAKVYPPKAQESLQFFPRESETAHYPTTGKKFTVRDAALIGQHTCTNTRFVGRNFLTVMVVFQPGFLFRMTKLPAHEVANQYLDADIILGTGIRETNEKLAECKAADYQTMISIVETFLILKIKKLYFTPRPFDKIGARIINFPLRSIDWYANEACLSTRQFDRVFLERMGVSPKLFFRILRLERIMNLKNLYPESDWLHLALQTGYYDYQHLAKEFNLLTGYSPTQFYETQMTAPERYFGEREVYPIV